MFHFISISYLASNSITTYLMKQFLFIFFIGLSLTLSAQEVAVLKYNGGGDWYSNPTALPNLIEFTNTNTKTKIRIGRAHV